MQISALPLSLRQGVPVRWFTLLPAQIIIHQRFVNGTIRAIHLQHAGIGEEIKISAEQNRIADRLLKSPGLSCRAIFAIGCCFAKIIIPQPLTNNDILTNKTVILLIVFRIISIPLSAIIPMNS